MNLLAKSLKLVNLAKVSEPMPIKKMACTIYDIVPTKPSTWVEVLLTLISITDGDDGERAARIAMLIRERFKREETARLEEHAALIIYNSTFGSGYLAMAALLSAIDKDALYDFILKV